jgi:hypothetical protein
MTRPALWLRGKVSTHPSAEGMMSVSDCPLWEPTVLRGIVVSSGAIPLCERLDGRKNAVCAKSHTSPCEVRATSEDRHSSRPCQREGWPPPGSVVFFRLMRVPRYHRQRRHCPVVVALMRGSGPRYILVDIVGRIESVLTNWLRGILCQRRGGEHNSECCHSNKHAQLHIRGGVTNRQKERTPWLAIGVRRAMGESW